MTHLIVRPRRPSGLTRLVAIDIVEPAENDEVVLRCTVEEARELDSAQDFAYVRWGDAPAADPKWDVGVEQVFTTPYYGSTELQGYVGPYDDRLGVSFDRVPKGEIEIRRASAVICSDGEPAGHVDGFVVDADEGITHLVLERGHLWTKRRVSIAIGTVTKVETDAVTVGLTASQLEKLPAVRVHRWLHRGARS